MDDKQIINCPGCHYRYRITDQTRGRTVVCKSCRAHFFVPAESNAVNRDKSSDAVSDEYGNVRRQDEVFAEIVVEHGWLLRRQVGEVLEEQKSINDKTGSVVTVGDLLVTSGAITDKQRLTVLEEVKARVSEDEKQKERANDDETAGLEITVTADRLTAYVNAPSDLSAQVTPDFIKDLLKKKGIVYGLVDDERLSSFIDTPTQARMPLKVAEGSPPQPGRETRIKLHFNPDPFGVGAAREGGRVDFRDRGNVPQVKEGDLLAELIPGAVGREGLDIHGHPIPGLKPPKVMIRAGRGVVRSEDGTKAYAKTAGRPEKSAEGILYVFPDYMVRGDVDLTTGHVVFDGHIEVTGSVQDGFQVKGGSLTAQEVLKADVDVAGDVVVLGGIIGGRIKCGGNIRATYVQGGLIEAMGDVIVEKEIRHSGIESGGMLICRHGNILGSDVTAKRGIEVTSVGSEAAKPCLLYVGVDAQVRRKVQQLKADMENHMERSKKLSVRVEDLCRKSGVMAMKLTQAELIHDKADFQIKALKARLNQDKNDWNESIAKKVNDALAKLKTAKNEAEGALEHLLPQQDTLLDRVDELRSDIRAISMTCADIREEIDQLIEWSRSQGSQSIVKASGTIYPGTVIQGLYSLMTIREDLSHVVVAEMKMKTPDDVSKWSMVITPMS
jgi:uncharacterized protein